MASDRVDALNGSTSKSPFGHSMRDSQPFEVLRTATFGSTVILISPAGRSSRYGEPIVDRYPTNSTHCNRAKAARERLAIVSSPQGLSMPW
jgi:hypothetical protein